MNFDSAAFCWLPTSGGFVRDLGCRMISFQRTHLIASHEQHALASTMASLRVRTTADWAEAARVLVTEKSVSSPTVTSRFHMTPNSRSNNLSSLLSQLLLQQPKRGARREDGMRACGAQAGCCASAGRRQHAAAVRQLQRWLAIHAGDRHHRHLHGVRFFRRRSRRKNAVASACKQKATSRPHSAQPQKRRTE